MNRWIEDFLNVLLPPVCHVCGEKLAPHERFACSHCLAQLPRTGYHRRRLNPMEERFAGQFPFERATGHFFYTRDSALSILIQDMKYRRFPAIGNMLGRLAAAELFTTGFFSGIDFVMPVPMHWAKQLRRGYNQTHHIAAGISEATGIPVCLNLKAVRSHKTQTAMTKEQRLVNTAGLFGLQHPEELDGKGVLLLDDICTTGSTLRSAAEATVAAAGCRLSLMSIGITF